MAKKPASGTVRIIAGEWRSRKLPVADVAGLRPSTDRVRETLFNWLQHSVIAADCLDLFAGSGALGFEAASRGANSVTLIERDKKAQQGLQQSIDLLKTEKVNLVHGDAMQWLASADQAYDIVFVDPPFTENLSSRVLQQLSESNCLKPDALIYLEEEKNAPEVQIPAKFEVIKQAKAGQVRYALLKVI